MTITKHEARGLNQGLRLRNTHKRRAQNFIDNCSVCTIDELDYATNALIGFAQLLIDEFDTQRRALANVPRTMQAARYRQWDTSCGFEQRIWKKCLDKLTDLAQTNDKYAPKTSDQCADCWEQLKQIWNTAQHKTETAVPKLR